LVVKQIFGGGLSYLSFYLVMNVHYFLCIFIILCELAFFYILYKLYVPLVVLLSKEVLPDFAILSFSSSFLMLYKFVGRVFGNIHYVGTVGCYTSVPLHSDKSAPLISRRAIETRSRVH
jgi:hypothetical protein